MLVRNGPQLRPVSNFLMDRTVQKDAPSASSILEALNADTFQPMKANTTPNSAAPGSSFNPHLVYYGGRVLKNAGIYNIYLGDYWKTGQGAQDKDHNDGFAKAFGKSSMKGILAEYGAGPTTFEGSIITAGNPTHITNTEAQNIVRDLLKTGKLKRNAEGIYQVILPPGCVGEFDGMTLPDGSPADTKHGIGGWHMSFLDDQGVPVYYDLISYGDRSNGIDFNGVGKDNLSIVESHELVEAITDPDVNSPDTNRRLGWYDFNTVPIFNAQWAEIGDISILQAQLGGIFGGGGGGLKDAFGMVDGYAMQKEWSNVDNKSELGSVREGPVQPLPAGQPYPDGVEIAPPLSEK